MSVFAFVDAVDNSGITAADNRESPDYASYEVRSPGSRSLIRVKYFHQATSAGVRASLKNALLHMINAGAETNGLTVCGFDTETGLGTKGKKGKKGKQVELIQLAVDNEVILIRKCLFDCEFWGPFFLNTLCDKKIVFAGAELATADALDLLAMNWPVVGLLDLTSVLSQDHGDNFENPRMLSLHLSDNDSLSLSLRAMYSGAFSVPWVKDKAITMSNWGLSTLSLPQIKYAALDAWTGAELGRMVLVKFKTKGIYKMIFSTNNDHVKTPAANGELLVQQILAQASALDALAFKDPKQVVLSNMQANPRLPHSCIDVHSSSYGNHIGKGKAIDIRIISPGGSRAGLSVMTRASEVKGKKSTIDLDKNWRALMHGAMDHSNDVDQRMATKLASSTCSTIVRMWRNEFDAKGINSGLKSSIGSTPQPKKGPPFKVRLLEVPESDKLLRQVRLSVSDFVRSHFVPRDFFPSQIAAEARRELNVLEAPTVQGPTRAVKTIHSLAWQILSAERFNNTSPLGLTPDQQASMAVHKENLNASQGQALDNAFRFHVSVIKGPPGTGKTRTIASIADVALTAGRRALIIAPGNSASRRILESLVKTGFEEACLLVSEEYFYEWHEEAYGGESLGQFVHTKSTFVDPDSQGARTNNDRSAAGRATRDFRERSETEHVSKWLKVANGTDNGKDPKPAIVIGTHGSISFNGVGEIKGKKSGKLAGKKWAKQVKNIVAIQSIDMLIIDETSQLWSGYGLSLLSRLPALKNIVLVGDEDQLPPFGVTDVPTLRSLFDAAITHRDIPRAVLNVTYRLPRPIAQILSKTIYNDNLNCERHLPSDLNFQEGLVAVLSSIARSQLPRTLSPLRLASFDAKLLLDRLCAPHLPPANDLGPFRSLLWIHHESAAHKNSAQSQGNVGEAKVIVSLVAQLLSMLEVPVAREVKSIAATKIVIITGYLEQKDELERQLAKQLSIIKFRGLGEVDLVDFVKSSMIVNTTDSYQGQEAEIVFISCVRSLKSPSGLTGLGFAKDQRRSNVMLSRASQLMVVVGDALNMAAELGKAGGGGATRPKPLLLPALAYWCSDHASMYKINKGNSSLISFKLPFVPGSAVSSTGVQAPAPAVASAPIPPPPPAVTPPPLTGETFAAMSPLAKSIALVLVDAPGRSMSLSQLAEKIPLELRQGHKSFIVPVKLIECVSLIQLHSGNWIATLFVDPRFDSAQPLLTPADPTVSVFREAVRRVLLKNGGTVSIDVLANAIPRAQRPGGLNARILPLVSELPDIEVTQTSGGNKLVRLIEAEEESIFAALVRGLLIEAGGCISLLNLSGKIPKAQRPTAPAGSKLNSVNAFRNNIVAALGAEVVVCGKKSGSMVTLVPRGDLRI